jgi:integrase/recombinase XerC
MINNFINYLHLEKRYSEHTLLAYKKDIHQFIEFAGISEFNELIEIDSKLIRGWVINLIDDKIENRSINRKLSSLRSLFRWLKKEKHIESNPMIKVIAPKTTKRLPQFAKESELKEEKLNQFFSTDFEGLRDQLLVEMFYQTGVRLNELINLRDSNIGQQSIKVLGKREKERIIPISKALYNRITEYREATKALSINTPYLFTLNNGNKLYPKFVYRKINSYLSKASSLDRCSPHVLRHTFATHMLNNGASLESLKNILGHASLSATQIYTHNSFAKLTSIYLQAHPRGHKDV